MIPPRDYYTALAKEQLALADRLQARYDRLSIVRLIVFLAYLGLLILCWTSSAWLGLALTLLGVALFGYGVRLHQRIGQRAARARVQWELAEAELLGLQHQFTHWPDGEEFLDPSHPYAVDLDLFGPHSLYQFLNRTVTAPGARRLADQLRYPATHAVSERRRAAGIELAGEPAWCLSFRTLGSELRDDPAYTRRLLEWLQRPPVIEGAYARAMRWAAPLLAVAGLWFSFTQEPWQLGLLFFLPAFLLVRRYGEAAAAEHAFTAQAGKMLAGYGLLLRHLEERDAGSSPGASAALVRLAFFVSQLDVRYNPFVFVLEITGLWSLQWLSRLDDWRSAHREDLPRWLDVLAETDARLSWATLRFNRPEWTEPDLTDARVLEATALGHPLLKPEVRVTNDIHMSTDGHIELVTGSNMAGKSTWLRTVGVNIVLARAGGPVCARHLRTAALQVWTSMRTQDALSESTSSFYAELKRLKAIIEAVSDPGQQVYFLLDEILKGTNSRDRHTGSRALIKQLIRDRGAGIIATHDLELAALEEESNAAGERRVENYAMEVATKNGELVFDYKLHRGVSQSFNATALMARMGIEIDPADIKLTHD